MELIELDLSQDLAVFDSDSETIVNDIHNYAYTKNLEFYQVQVFIASCKNITFQFNALDNKLGDEKLKILCENLLVNEENMLEYIGLAGFFFVSLKIFNLGGNRLENASPLFSLLYTGSALQNIKELVLWGLVSKNFQTNVYKENMLGDESATNLSNALKTNPSLEEIELGSLEICNLFLTKLDNCIGPKGTTCIAHALKHNTRLIEIRFSG